jgi:hypothetical protein
VPDVFIWPHYPRISRGSGTLRLTLQMAAKSNIACAMQYRSVDALVARTSPFVGQRGCCRSVRTAVCRDPPWDRNPSAPSIRRVRAGLSQPPSRPEPPA